MTMNLMFLLIFQKIETIINEQDNNLFNYHKTIYKNELVDISNICSFENNCIREQNNEIVLGLEFKNYSPFVLKFISSEILDDKIHEVPSKIHGHLLKEMSRRLYIFTNKCTGCWNLKGSLKWEITNKNGEPLKINGIGKHLILIYNVPYK